MLFRFVALEPGTTDGVIVPLVHSFGLSFPPPHLFMPVPSIFVSLHSPQIAELLGREA